MTQRKQIILACLVVSGVAAAAILLSKKLAINPAVKTNTGFGSTTLIMADVADKISAGEKLLFSETNSSQETAAKAFADLDYQQAASLWSQSLEQQSNDPETLIYYNNARIGDRPSYSLAVPVPIDGETNVAQEILRGAAQAQQTINDSGGLNNRPIKLIIANDRNNPQTAKKLAATFAQNPDVLGIIGHFSSDVTLEAARIYQEQGLVIISPTSTSVALSNVGSYIFRTVSSDCFAGNALVEYLTQNLQVKQTALLYNSASSYSTSLRDVFRNGLEAKGGEVVAEFNFSEPNFNIADILSKIKQEQAKAIVLFPNSSGTNALNTLDKTFLLAQINQGELPLLGGDSLHKPRTLQFGQENVNGMVLAVPWQIKNNNREFSQTAKQLWGGNVNWRTALTYDATMALAAAVKIDPTREGVQQALLSDDFTAEGASGEIKFLPTGDRSGEIELVKVVAGKNSGFGYDFVPVTNANYPPASVCK